MVGRAYIVHLYYIVTRSLICIIIKRARKKYQVTIQLYDPRRGRKDFTGTYGAAAVHYTYSKQIADRRILVAYLLDDAGGHQVRADLRQQQPGIPASFLRAERRNQPVHQHLTCAGHTKTWTVMDQRYWPSWGV